MADDRVVLTASGSTSSQGSKRTLAPAPGVTAPPTDGSSYRFLSDVIIARGLVEPAAMKAALQASLAGRCLTEILVDNGELSEEDLARTLAEHHRLDHVDLDVFAVDPQATALVEPDVARRYGAVPIALLASGAVVVALYDPNGSTAVLEFAGLTDRVIQPAVASRTQIEALISSLRQGGHPPVAARAAAPAPESHLHSVPAGRIAIPPAEPFRSAPPPHAEHVVAPMPAVPAAPSASAPGYGAPALPPAYGATHTPGAPPTHAAAPQASPAPATAPQASPAPTAAPEASPAPTAAPEAVARPEPAPAPPPADAGGERAAHDRRLEDLCQRAETAERGQREADERAETAERRHHEADERARAAEESIRAAEERARAAEERIRAAEERARAAEELTRLADARARASDERALAAGELVDAAEARAEGMSSAADAANETLARLVRACEMLEHEAQSRGPEIDVLRAALDAERSQRAQLETQLRYPPQSEELATLQERIAELERALSEQRAAAAAPPAAAARAPSPPREQARAHPPEPEAAPETEVDAYVAPSIAPMIDIVGEPGVPYVSALAPMPSNDAQPRKVPKSTTAKARGLRRLISAIKRGA